jgi:hypothetical protein
MNEIPKSLTAIVHVRFQYGGGISTKPRRAELLSQVVERASELNPELQEMLVNFAGHVDNKPSERRGNGQSPE